MNASLMRCVVCKTGEVKPGVNSFMVERGTMTLVLKGVSARGHTGVQLAVQDYVAA